MVKRIISFSLSSEAITAIDECAKGFKGGRSGFVQWLYEHDFFLPQTIRVSINQLAKDSKQLMDLQVGGGDKK